MGQGSGEAEESVFVECVVCQGEHNGLLTWDYVVCLLLGVNLGCSL